MLYIKIAASTAQTETHRQVEELPTKSQENTNAAIAQTFMDFLKRVTSCNY
jgi:hypothetical protein